MPFFRYELPKTLYEIIILQISPVYKMKSCVHQKQKNTLKRQNTFAMNLKTNHHAKNHFTISLYYT